MPLSDEICPFCAGSGEGAYRGEDCLACFGAGLTYIDAPMARGGAERFKAAMESAVAALGKPFGGKKS
jgi:hypothetical protein